MFQKLIKALFRANKKQKGMTGLETAIILIAFVTVAAVFGYAVLSAGIFSAEQGKETLYAGLEQAKSSMEIKGSIIAYGAPGKEGDINDCDTIWTEGTGVTANVTTGFGGGHSNVFVLDNGGGGFDGTTVAYGSSNISDLSQKSLVTLYIKTDADISGITGDKLQLALCTDSSAATAVEMLDLPAVTKGVWTLFTLSIDNSLYSDPILTVRLDYTQDLTSAANPVTIWVDDIVAGPPYTQADLIVFTVANAIAGKPIDLTPSPHNKTVISYTDQLIHQSNVEFSVNFVGDSDDDYLLELGEQVEILVPLGFLTQPPGANESFGLQMKPPHGSVVTIERTIPANVDAVMDLY